jgi:hypothetical protein
MIGIPTRSVSEGVRIVPRLRFELVFDDESLPTKRKPNDT